MIQISKMSREQMHEFYEQFQYDPVAEGVTTITPYSYNAQAVDRYYDKQVQQGKIHFAILLNQLVIGDIYLKHFNPDEKSCEFGIYLINDDYKGKGYGTQAERLMLEYVFQNMEVDVVFADTKPENHRGRHVLEKAGFRVIDIDEERIYLECRRNNRINGKGEKPGSIGST